MFKTSLKNIVFLTTILLSSNVFAVEFKGKFIQGHFILGKTHPDSKIWVDKRKVKITEDGYFVFGIGRDRKYITLQSTLYLWWCWNGKNSLIKFNRFRA